jgi:hypothetical protein
LYYRLCKFHEEEMRSKMPGKDGNDEDMVKKQLFGSVRRLPVIGDLPVPSARLRDPLPDEDYGLFFFCSGCGTVLPVLPSAIKAIAGEEMDNYENLYIAVERCDLCHGRFVNARLSEIPSN